MQVVIDAPVEPVASAASAVPAERVVVVPRTGGIRKLAHGLAHGALRRPVVLWGVLDVAAAFSAFVAAHHLSPSFDFTDPKSYNIGLIAGVFAVQLFCFNYALGLYDRHNFAWIGRILRSAFLATLLSLVVVTLACWLFGYIKIGRVVLFNAFVLSCAGTVAFRLIARDLARRTKVRVLFVGHRHRFQPLMREMRRLYRGFYDRPCHMEQPHGSTGEREQQLVAAVCRFCPDEIVVEDNDSTILDLVRQSAFILRTGCEIRTHAAYHQELLGEVPVETIDHRALVGDGLKICRHGTNLTKRMLDIALSGVGLVLGSPLMLLCAVLVKVTSPGPVIYRQVRVGRFGHLFTIYKFRTMCQNAEQNGAVWASKGDARATTVGRVLRKTRLDELPQLWNILRGDMSFVGPRPERPEFVETLRQKVPYYDLRHLVPPGLTGWAQVRYRYGASVEDAQRKLAFDLYYVRHYSLGFDLAICLRTVVAMAKGAR